MRLGFPTGTGVASFFSSRSASSLFAENQAEGKREIYSFSSSSSKGIPFQTDLMIYTAIDTFYVTDEALTDSPSRKHGIDVDAESQLRLFGCELIQESGILLKLPQAVMATGQVLFHRFYCKKSFARFNVKRVAASCVWLASKLEESHRKLQHVLNVFHRMECRRENKPLGLLDPFSKKYEEMRTNVVRTERHILKEMGFICHVEHPHKFIINYLTQLEAPPAMMQEAWNLANDSLRTTLCVRFKSEVVACGVVYVAACRFGTPLPESPPWWKVFNAEKHEIDEVCLVLANLYRQPKAVYIEIGKDSKSFLLTSRTWDSPTDAQLDLSKVVGINGTSQMETEELKESEVKHGDKLKISIPEEAKVCFEESRVETANGESRENNLILKGKPLRNMQDGSIEKSREKDKDRSKVRDKEYGQDRERNRDKERDSEADRDKDRDRGDDGYYGHDKERNRVKDRDYRNSASDRTKRGRDHHKDRLKEREDYDRVKDTEYRSKERSHSEKGRHHSSSRDKDLEGKERHRHHLYT